MKRTITTISAVVVILLIGIQASTAYVMVPADYTTLDKLAADSLYITGLMEVADAERVLGEAAHFGDSHWTEEANAGVLRCTYVADSADEKTGKTGALYVMIESYNEVSSAHKTYSDILSGNQNLGNVSVINDLGDEAYFLSDGQNFLLILVRKGPKVLRLKVNKITAHTSLDNFHQMAREVVNKL
ncbi:MAG: hypothetical protein RIF36_02530 [Imperialibacter sp.]|uniref:hypothetical protein n=1 Tax=Imperialibacter sp. TaxID=2038411 RepID=UPI0032EB050A